MTVGYEIAEPYDAAAEKQARVREAIRAHHAALTLEQLRTDVEGKAPSFGALLKRRLSDNARHSRRRLLLVLKNKR